MKKTDLAYMAGIIDGEGCIRIGKGNQGGNNKKVNYTLKMSIGMANPYIPQMFRFVFGGHFFQSTEGTAERLPTWQWGIDSNKAVDVLRTLLPYLKLKKSEAELAIEFQKGKRICQSGIKRGENRTDEEQALEEAQYILMHNLKDKSGVTNVK